jgi:hypothetical protein
MGTMMIRRATRWGVFAAGLAGIGLLVPAKAADRYDGPRPPKPDVLYLVHADNLVATEAAEARQEGKKDEPTFTIPGAASPARTPLAEPIFLIQADQLLPERLELYKLEVKGGRREVQMSKKRRGGARPLHLSVTKLDGKLYRVEVDETLDDGEYSISPSDSNRVFCFQVY